MQGIVLNSSQMLVRPRITAPGKGAGIGACRSLKLAPRLRLERGTTRLFAAPQNGNNSNNSPSPEPKEDENKQEGSGTPPRKQRKQQPQKRTGVFGRIAQFLGEDNMLLRIVLNGAALYFLVKTFPLTRPDQSEGAFTFTVPYSTFLSHTKSNQVSTVTVEGATVSYRLRPESKFLSSLRKTYFEGLPEDARGDLKLRLSAVRPPDLAAPYDVLMKNGVPFSAVEKQNKWGSSLVFLLYLVSIAWVLSRFTQRLGGGAGGRRHRGGAGGNGQGGTAVSFDDVAGVDEAKEELMEVVEFLRNPDRFQRLGSRPPSGVLLVGPPGTGKTLLARAVASEAGVPFFSISASEFVELYVGMGASRVRDLFTRARKEAPAIVFIDEIDAIGKGRDSRLRSVGNDEREQTLNQLLTELDGFDSDRGAGGAVICLAATNRPDVLDAALLRPGRFDRRVSVEPPDRLGRLAILEAHVRRKELPLEEGVSLEGLAAGTTGFTGADLANLVNEAALLAGRRGGERVGMEDFGAAMMRAIAGIEKKRSLMGSWEKEVVARHEVGHALVATAVARALPFAGRKVEKLSIVPRTGGALGFTYIPPSQEDRSLTFDAEVRGQLAMLLGGRAAEELTVGPVSSGAADDIRRATGLAYRSVAELGLCANVGPINVPQLLSGGDEGALLRDGGGNMAGLVEREVKDLLDKALTAAKEVIEANRSLHTSLSARLVQEERIEGAALDTWLDAVTAPPSVLEFLSGGVPQERLLLLFNASVAEAAAAAALAPGAKGGKAVKELPPPTATPAPQREA